MSSGEIEQRPWGSWKVLEEGIGYKVKRIEVLPGHRLSLQFHHHRSEHWVVVSGKARVIIDGRSSELGVLQSVSIPAGVVHRLENPWSVPLIVVEIQKGDLLSEEDIVRLEDDYQRVVAEGTKEGKTP